MKNPETRRWLVPLAVLTTVVVADQLTKWWAVSALGPQPMSRMIPLVGDWSRFVYTRNTGMAFSLFQDFPQLLTLSAGLIIIGAIYFYWFHLPNRRWLPQLVIGLVVGGGLGNLIDRVRVGYVIDFISIGWFPVFNLADSAISVGAALLMLLFLRDEFASRDGGDERRAISA